MTAQGRIPDPLSGKWEPTQPGDGRPEARKRALTRHLAGGHLYPDHPAPITVRSAPEPPS